MTQGEYPQITREKHTVPTIYLDTCVMIEMAKYKSGICTDVHKEQIGQLYNALKTLMEKRLILCPIGNQLEEIGTTGSRKVAMDFLLQFANCSFFSPDLIKYNQMKEGFRSFVNCEVRIYLGTHTAFENKNRHHPFIICVIPKYSPETVERLRCNKQHIVNALNEMKEQKKMGSGFLEQLNVELNADYQLFRSAVEGEVWTSEKTCSRYLEEIGEFRYITGCSTEITSEQLNRYGLFLYSPYYKLLPYVWIRANLWAHLAQRSNKIVHGDNLDVEWAAAYLPFVDYAVTDKAFCSLLQSSGLDEEYGTKVYSFKTIPELLAEMSENSFIQ